MTKWPVQKPTHRTTQQHVDRHLEKKLVFMFYGLFDFFFN